LGLSPGPGGCKCPSDALSLQCQQFLSQHLPAPGDVKMALAAVAEAGLLRDKAILDQLLEYPGQRLLGDLQNHQEIGDPQSRISMHEMEDPVVRPPKPEFIEYPVRLASKVPVGKKQKLHERHCLSAAVLACSKAPWGIGSGGLRDLLPRDAVSRATIARCGGLRRGMT